MVERIFVEKKPELAQEAGALLDEIRSFLQVPGAERIRILNRYDVEGMDAELFSHAVSAVFSEPQVDIVSKEPDLSGARVFAVEYLPGQFDQRADSAAQCIQLITQGERPLVRSAKVYVIYGSVSDDEFLRIRKHVINPVEAREASLSLPKTLSEQYPDPEPVPVLSGFRNKSRAELGSMLAEYGLAMDLDDLAFCQAHFQSEQRDPTMTELRVIDTYWSDHCRHTTFHTILDSVSFADPELEKSYRRYLETREKLGIWKPICLMDLGTIAAKALLREGKLNGLDQSEEINACTVRVTIERDGKQEPWLLLIKNETHNHPTEIEPFGGAATCIGGAIRDPLSGRSYVYGAMRLTGAADPTRPAGETLPGKLPQRKLVTFAAQGYSSYGNQIGLATGIVDELYHPGYAAKHMEIGAVIGAAPAQNVVREAPEPGDLVILLGGGTGRDGIGGATGSSKSHTVHSVETCGAEVQKGNAPEERKLQRLFRNPEASRMIRRCNDFGAGGVSVAIGELAPGLDIDLNTVPRKYEGLDGTELAISESQERMAVVIRAADAKAFLSLASAENLNAVPVASVTESPRLVMHWNGERIVDLPRAFLDTNGAEKHMHVQAPAPSHRAESCAGGFAERMRQVAQDLSCCYRRGLSERFDSTIGAGTILMPFGGRNQLTPIQAMAHRIPLLSGHTDDCSLMAWGFDPFRSEQSPYHGAYEAVAESVSKLIASGAENRDIYLTFQEYFPKPGKDPGRWGLPFASLLGAFDAQMDLGIAAIGGKDSMSGTFEHLDVPPTLVSFAVTMQKSSDLVSPEWKAPGHPVILLEPMYRSNGLPDPDSLRSVWYTVTKLIRNGKAVSCSTPEAGGIGAAVMKQCFGNGIGFRFADGFPVGKSFSRLCGAFLLELSEALETGTVVGMTCKEKSISCREETIPLSELLSLYEGRLEPVYPTRAESVSTSPKTCTSSFHSWPAPAIRTAVPRVLIPVFPGTNCEYDSVRAVEEAGAEAHVLVLNNLSSQGIRRSIDRFATELRSAQMLFIPGGFSGGDEPDGSGKFITAFLRGEAVKDEIADLLDCRGGLICGICNGFQALIKLGLVPYGKILDPDASMPTLTYNTIGRHQSRIVQVRVSSNLSPFLSMTRPGEVYSVPISHGEGRFLADPVLVRTLEKNGQIATQYVNPDGKASMDIRFNPNGSICAIEGITSPDGRVFGKMGHAERIGPGLYRNVPGNYDMHMFEAAVRYFK